MPKKNSIRKSVAIGSCGNISTASYVRYVAKVLINMTRRSNTKADTNISNTITNLKAYEKKKKKELVTSTSSAENKFFFSASSCSNDSKISLDNLRLKCDPSANSNAA